MDRPDDASMEPLRLQARWLFPVAAEPIENGEVGIVGGRIDYVGPARPGAATDLGNCAILPGLINAHTHLEFSTITSPLEPARPFASWIGSVVQWRRQRQGTAAEAIQAGLDESARSGVTTLAEIATTGWEDLTLATSDAAVFRFQELLGLTDEAVATQIDMAEAIAEQAASGESHVQYGLSPHTPFTVHPQLYRRSLEIARDANLPVAIHLAETTEELQLLSEGTGPLVEMLRRFGVWQEGLNPPGSRLLDWLRPLADVPRALVVHGNYLQADEMDWLAGQPHISVVYCPRTHAFFGHNEHPWREMLARGVNVTLGTDSRASNPDLNLWNEVRFLADRYPDVPTATLLGLVTRSAASALGIEADRGTLAEGKAADLAVFRLGDGVGDPWTVLRSPGTEPVGAMRSGCWLTLPPAL
ncbi:amidohydrolase family protein [Maioricimonas sp. JC845]|uniref:amidohydrolase family protein n=1 Tax=Maioricimonas sp. JC845 TaxID=3232138 RepID=UPI00345A41C2